MEQYSDLIISAEQRKIVEEKFRAADEFAKNINFDNLPKREDHPDVARPATKVGRVKKA